MSFNDFEDTINLKEIQEEINSKKLIKNEQLENYIKFVKSKSKIEEDDLKDIEEIILDSKTFSGKNNFVDFNEIKLFPKLKKIKIYNLGLNEKEINLINNETNIEEVYFENCGIIDLDKLKKVKKMHIANCRIEDIESIENLNLLEELKIESMELKKYDFLLELNNLKKLYLLNIKENVFDLIPELKNIEFLSIDGLEQVSEEKIAKFSNLKTLAISKRELEKYANLIEKLEKENIEIFIEDVYECI